MTYEEAEALHYLLILKLVRNTLKLYPSLEYEDCLQEAKLALFQALERYDPQRGSLSALLKVSIRNKLSTYAKQQTQITAPLEANDATYSDDRDVFLAISELSEEEQVIIAHLARGTTVKKIAKELGIGTTTAKLRVKQARQALRDKLKD